MPCPACGDHRREISDTGHDRPSCARRRVGRTRSSQFEVPPSCAAQHSTRWIRQNLPSRPRESHPEPLTGRVEDWRAGLGRSLYSLFLALSFASVTLSRPCHVSSPRHVERSVRISRTALSCLLHLNGYGTYPAGATFGISQRTLS